MTLASLVACGGDSPPSPIEDTVLRSVQPCGDLHRRTGVVAIAPEEDGWWVATILHPSSFPVVVDTLTWWISFVPPSQLPPGSFQTNPGRAHQARVFKFSGGVPPAEPVILDEVDIPPWPEDATRKVVWRLPRPVQLGSGEALGLMLPLVYDTAQRELLVLGSCPRDRSGRGYESSSRAPPYAWVDLEAIGLNRVPYVEARRGGD